jgi:hypothetical protein
MNALTFPNRTLIEVVVPCRKLAAPPTRENLLALRAHVPPLPALCELDGQEPFAEVRVGWWEQGLYVALQVRKPGPIAVSRREPLRNDCLVVLVNLAPGPQQRRPPRRCLQFVALPRGGGPDRRQPLAWQELFGHGPPQRLAPPRALLVAAAAQADGYSLALALTQAALADTELQPGQLLGFEYLVHDTMLGTQTWAAPAEAPVLDVPQLWGTLELV